MTIAFDVDNSRQSEGPLTASAYCVLPSSSLTDLLLLNISFSQPSGLSVTLNAPTRTNAAGTVTADLRSSASGLAIYSFPGGTTGNANITWTQPVAFQAWCEKMTGQASSSPFSSSYSTTNNDFSHTFNAGATSPEPGAVFYAMIHVPTIPRDGALFNSPDNIFSVKAQRYPNFPGDPDTYKAGMSVAVRYAANAGDAGSHTWTSVGGFFALPASVSSAACGVWITPLQAPSPPTVITPATNDQITAGKTVDITYTASDDPNFDSSALDYEASYSNNNGLTKTVIDTSGAGILTIPWDTTGLTPGLYLVYVRADNGTDFGDYGVSGEFRIFADTVPNPPTELAPVGYIAKDANQRFSWKAQNPDADTQSAFELMWDNDPAFGSSSTTGTVVSANEYHDFTANNDILSTADTFYWRVRTKGAIDNTFGAWSQIKTVITRDAPATPNITAPVAASPPTTGKFTVTFTSTAAPVEYLYTISQGSLSYSSTWIPGAVSSFVIAVEVANSVACTLTLKIKDAYGLESAADSETFTPSYTGPTTPTLDLTLNASNGSVQCVIGNPVTVLADHTRLKLWEDTESEEDAIWISKRLPNNSTFIYSQAKAGVAYNMKAYAFLATGGFTPSTTETFTLEFDDLQIHTVTKSSVVSDADKKVTLQIEGKTSNKIEKNHQSVGHIGASEYATYAGVSGNYERAIYNCFIPADDTDTRDRLIEILEANAKICSRDRNGVRLFGKFLNVDLNRILTSDRFPLEVIEQRHKEEIR